MQSYMIIAAGRRLPRRRRQSMTAFIGQTTAILLVLLGLLAAARGI